MAQVSARCYPNGEFTLGFAPKRLKHGDIAVSKERFTEDELWATRALKEHGYEAMAEYTSGREPLGLSNVPIRPTRAPKGMQGISTNGRRMVRNGCYLLEQEFGKGRCGFMTLTLPELTAEDYQSVHENWSSIIKTFLKWFKRTLGRAGVLSHIVGVTEIQEKRHEKTGKPYFHFHLCFPCRPKRSYKWYVPATQARMAWERAVSAYCVHGYGFEASLDSVVVKKSLAGYLSKYLSKGGGNVARAIEHGLPLSAIGHWWKISDGLRDSIRKRTLCSDGLAQFIWYNVRALKESGALRYLTFCYIPDYGGHERCIGLSGCFTPGMNRFIRTIGNIEFLTVQCQNVESC